MLLYSFFLGNQLLQAQKAQNICQQQNKEISKFISKFENLQKKGAAKQVLELFTPPTEPEDVATYAFLAGLDAGLPRLYSTGTTNFVLLSFGVVDVYQSWWVNGCIVNVIEKRKYYPHGDYSIKPWTRRHVLNFELVYWFKGEERIWLVESYRPYGFSYGKFGGFEF
ncbi:MAG: hypothetical protein G01um101444_433 [Parcubacteria group bacterium Gr01-1014_44]|nr:MAG: hypothetical protein G01um101444_433 [Parcubacteria group bacterium Gr01-1014_44]